MSDNTIERTPVMDSTNIVSAGYKEASSILEIQFSGGNVYRYFDVPHEVFSGLITADSKGVFFQRNIRGKFNTLKMLRPEEVKL